MAALSVEREMQQRWIFQLGTARELCQAEVEAVVGVSSSLCPGLVEVQTLSVLDEQQAQTWQDRLGGTVKIALGVDSLPKQADEEQISDKISDYLLSLKQPKVRFAVGEWGRESKPVLDLSLVKEKLTQKGVKSRFCDNPRSGASAALLLHQQIVEILVIETADTILLAQTKTVQNIDEWTKRDRAKPYADRRKGMLPPKLARIMVNLGVAGGKRVKVYDPFCGTGTILMEAMMLGCPVCGSDSDVKAVLGSGENLEWLCEVEKISVSSQLLTREVTQVSATDLGGQIPLIVTEPFLGRQTPGESQLPNVFRGLEKMYWGALRAWSKLLTDQAKVVIVLPRVANKRGKVYNLESVLDKSQALGYTRQSYGLYYARPGAVVQREVCVLSFDRSQAQGAY